MSAFEINSEKLEEWHSWVYLWPLLLCIYPNRSDSLSTQVDDVPELQVGLVEVHHTGVLIHHHTHQVIREPLTALQVSHPQLLSIQHRHIIKMSDPDQEQPTYHQAAHFF